MDYVKIFLQCLSSIAWPLVVIFLVLFYKQQLESLLTNLCKIVERISKEPVDIELGEKFRMRFGNAIREVQERAKPLLPKGIPGVDMPPYEQSQKIVEKTPLPPNYAPPSISSYKYLYSLAEISARSAIIEAWVEIELSVLQLHETKENLSSSSQIISTTIIVGKLAEQKVIGDDTFTLFEELRHLRNQVVHAVDYQPLAEQAKAYIDLALRLVAFFRNLHLKIVEDSQRDRK